MNQYVAPARAKTTTKIDAIDGPIPQYKAEKTTAGKRVRYKPMIAEKGIQCPTRQQGN